MNPQFHSEFEALCALYHAGEITEEEWALLQIHMAYCESCHQRFLQYETITSRVVPAMAAIAASEPGQVPPQSDEALHSAEQRLMSRVDPSPRVTTPVKRGQVPWKLAAPLAAACLIAGVGLIAIWHREFKPPSQTGIRHPTVEEAKTPPAPVVKIEPTRTALPHTENEETSRLESQLLTAQDQLKKANLARAEIEKNLEAERAARAQLSAERDTLVQQLTAAQSDAASLRENSDTVDLHTADLTAQVGSLEEKVRTLNGQIEEKDRALSDKDRILALDKDFLSHDRDIRNLIGARNLYIADIYDTNENGKTAKPFGRVFYTKNRSLVFYGFDLDKRAGIRRDASFQVWGRGSDKPLVSLGLFYQDDAHKRWILRCNDAKTLARLDMVFVTVEPPGGSKKPTGKQLLRAYLQIPANHP